MMQGFSFSPMMVLNPGLFTDYDVILVIVTSEFSSFSPAIRPGKSVSDLFLRVCYVETIKRYLIWWFSYRRLTS